MRCAFPSRAFFVAIYGLLRYSGAFLVSLYHWIVKAVPQTASGRGINDRTKRKAFEYCTHYDILSAGLPCYDIGKEREIA